MGNLDNCFLSVGRGKESTAIEIYLVLCPIPAVVYPSEELETVDSQRWYFLSEFAINRFGI